MTRRRLPCLAALLALAAPPAMADGFGFRTPSGNIYCNGSVDGGDLSCTIVSRDTGSAPAGIACPAGNELHVDMLQTGAVRAGCGGPSGRPSAYTDVAEYGATAAFGRISCVSQRTGFECRNADGRGFLLSRAAQRIW
ncbi:DUF6636 domain-containing protein [Wenxinia saemankumensis]|uniref:CVNH domain-containing protein n=1 Tax=Wenxinia saemankumensis TaxID=1447782 RepID=A0A1M6ABH6_9RHOB|nr:DUF6636 domain-containing protein [Wenxinia saemankumensis]SHI33728.1 hypothetical protein SAMN05444417_0339 [Wenxinia saemankumensis]